MTKEAKMGFEASSDAGRVVIGRAQLNTCIDIMQHHYQDDVRTADRVNCH